MGRRPEIAERCVQSLSEWVGHSAQVVCWAPGRINVIGGHTDYNAGLAMPAAIDRWIAVALHPRSDDQIRVRSLDFGGEYVATVGDLGRPHQSWEQFVRGSLDVFCSQYSLPSGFDAVFAGDVPHGAGLSSSAALTVAWMNALQSWCKVDCDAWSLVRLCQRVEHEHLGVQCGLLDQVGSHMAKADHVMLVDFGDLAVEQVPVRLPDVSWVVLHSGVRRELAQSAYSDRVRECAEGLSTVQGEDPSVTGFRDLKLAHLQRDTVWARRLRHVVTENQRVRDAARCMAAGDVEALGALLVQTHQSLRDDYEVTCPELDALVEIAVADDACWGARMVGGGFGGCTLNLVRADQAESFIQRSLMAYRARFDRVPRSFRFSLVGGATVA